MEYDHTTGRGLTLIAEARAGGGWAKTIIRRVDASIGALVAGVARAFYVVIAIRGQSRAFAVDAMIFDGAEQSVVATVGVIRNVNASESRMADGVSAGVLVGSAQSVDRRVDAFPLAVASLRGACQAVVDARLPQGQRLEYAGSTKTF